MDTATSIEKNEFLIGDEELKQVKLNKNEFLFGFKGI